MTNNEILYSTELPFKITLYKDKFTIVFDCKRNLSDTFFYNEISDCRIKAGGLNLRFTFLSLIIEFFSFLPVGATLINKNALIIEKNGKEEKYFFKEKFISEIERIVDMINHKSRSYPEMSCDTILE